MLIWATKDRHEVEEEEASRLVRPAPKDKPPRRDRRRNRVDAEPDPDMKSDLTVERDPDLSLNYKGAASRIVFRFAKKTDLIEAWNKQEKRKVYVSEDTLREKPGIYEAYKGQESPKKTLVGLPSETPKPPSKKPSDKQTLTGLPPTEPKKVPEVEPTKKVPYKPETSPEVSPESKKEETVAEPRRPLPEVVEPGTVPEPKKKQKFVKTKPARPSEEPLKPVKVRREVPKKKPVKEEEAAFETMSEQAIQSMAASPAFQNFARDSGHTTTDEDGKLKYQAIDGKFREFDKLTPEDKHLWSVLYRGHNRSKQIDKAVGDPEFRTFAKSQEGVVESERGDLLFPSEDGNKRFYDLSHQEQFDWVNKFRNRARDTSEQGSKKPEKEEESAKSLPESQYVFEPMSGQAIQSMADSPSFRNFARDSGHTTEDENGKLRYRATDGTFKEFGDLSFDDKQMWSNLYRGHNRTKQIDKAFSNPEFPTFAKSQTGVSEDERGRMLFPSKEGNKQFQDLSHQEQFEWASKFWDYTRDADRRRKRKIDLRVEADLSPEAKRLYQDVANPDSAISKQISSLSKDALRSKPQYAIPAFKGHVPDSVRNLGEMLEAIKETYEPPLPSPKVSTTTEEYEEAWSLAKDNLPIRIQTQVVLKSMHPNDVRELIRQYRAHFSEEHPLSPRKRQEFLDSASEEFVTDPRMVRPPDDAEFRAMSREEKIEAMHKRRMQVVTRSLLAREMVASEFRSKGLSGSMSDALAEFRLTSKSGESQEQRSERAEMLADRIFDSAIISGVAPLSEGNRKDILKELGGDSDSRKIAERFFMAQDYLVAKKKYLQDGSDDSFDEYSAPKDIVRGLLSAVEFLKNRSKGYQDRKRDVSKAFKVRVLGRLKALNPEKYDEVRELLEKAEVKQYEKDYPEYVKQYSEWKKENAKFERKRIELERQVEADREHFEEALRRWKERARELYEKHQGDSKSWPSSELKVPEPPKTLELDYISKRLGDPPIPPVKPTPPVGYVDYFVNPEEVERYRRQLTENTYAEHKSMKTAVYHGVEPYENTQRYVDWKTANPNRLSEGDLSFILKEAKRISNGLTDYKGVPEDVHCRKALDLAIRTFKDGAYSVGLPPPLYKRLLERLLGDSGSSVRTAKIGDENMSAQVDNILGRLDSVAETIQKRYASWGIPFKLAKELVNSLDGVADEIEVQHYGKDSFARRQAEVILRDSDEEYMDTFNAPQKPIQTDADEPYMRAYADDQTVGVQDGKSSTGRPLAP